MKRVLITGSAGRMGTVIAKGLKGKFHIRGFDITPTPEVEDSIVASLSDLDALNIAAQGVDAIIHLAGNPRSSASWDSTLESNIVGTYNIFESARIHKVKRIIFTSTCQVMFGYGEFAQVNGEMPPRPINYYGVSKVAGEALGSMYAARFGMEVICIRVGHFPGSIALIQGGPMKGRFLSPRDAVQLYEKALTQPGITYEIVYGVSNSSIRHLDLEHAKSVLGYEPIDWEDDVVRLSQDGDESV